MSYNSFQMKNQKPLGLGIKLGILFLFSFLGTSINGTAQTGQLDPQVLRSANQLYQSRNFDEAAGFFKQLFEQSGSFTYFEYYINCLSESRNFKIAEREIRKQRKTNQQGRLLVLWGYVLQEQGLRDEGEAKFKQAIDEHINTRQEVVLLGNSFFGRRLFEWAIRTYQAAEKELQGEQFHFELGRVYLQLRDYPRMIDEYLSALKEDENRLANVQSRFSSAFYYDRDGRLKRLLQAALYSHIQKNPNNLVFNRILVWYLLQQKSYAEAFVQLKSIDRRVGGEERTIFNMANLSVANKAYDVAMKAYDYLLAKGKESEFYQQVWMKKVEAAYFDYQSYAMSADMEKIAALDRDFKQVLSLWGESRSTLSLMHRYASFLTYYQHRSEDAVELLKRAVDLRGLSKMQLAQTKLLLADCQVCNDDLWGASLHYAQVIEFVKGTELGDEARWKKARLGYFMGAFKWAKAQLDIMKASTSKLTANDALELSLFLKTYASTNSADLCVKQVARADMYRVCRRADNALVVLDSALVNLSIPGLEAEILTRRADILAEKGACQEAVDQFETLLSKPSAQAIRDRLLMRIGLLYRDKLKNQAKSELLFQEIILKHPGSIYVEQARDYLRGN